MNTIKIPDVEEAYRDSPYYLGEDSTAHRKAILEDNLLQLDKCETNLKKSINRINAKERGKEALTKQTLQIQEEAKKKQQLLDNKRKALYVEKVRASKLAAQELPMSLTVKALLRQSDFLNSPIDARADNAQENLKENPNDLAEKENAMDKKKEEEMQEKYKQWNEKAKKRFNDSLKMDRQKKDREEALKEIDNAVKLHQRQFAQQLSSNKEMWYPCEQTDKVRKNMDQIKMQNAVEKISTECREHVIDELEESEDHVQKRFKNREFDLSQNEEKLLGCVPKFIQKNYEYLLEEDKFNYEFGKSEFDDSADDPFNMAYIESPPDGMAVSTEDELEQVITKLKERRSELLSRYEEELNSDDASPKMVVDKAIETDMRVSVDKGISTDNFVFEDKAIGTGSLIKLKKRHLFSRSAQVDLNTSGFLAAPKPFVSPMSSLHDLLDGKLSTLPEQDIGKARQLKQTSPENENWSSSSYCSLPSQHGMPEFKGQPNYPKCDICIGKKMQPGQLFHDQDNNPESVQIILPSSRSHVHEHLSTVNHDSSQVVKSTDYLKSIAEKYFPMKALPTVSSRTVIIPCAVPLSEPIRMRPTSSKSVQVDNASYTEHENPSIKQEENFEDSVIPSYNLNLRRRNLSIMDKNSNNSETTEPKQVSNFPSEPENISSGSVQNVSEKKSILHQVISNYLPPNVVFSEKTLSDDEENSSSDLESSRDESIKYLDVPKEQYIYHDLSTIQEMDSALTNSSLHQSFIDLKQSQVQDSVDHNQEIKTTPENLPGRHVSSINTPVSDISKHIQFMHKSPAAFSKVVEDIKASTDEDGIKQHSRNIDEIPNSFVNVLWSSIDASDQYAMPDLKASNEDNLKGAYKALEQSHVPESINTSSESLQQHTITSLPSNHSATLHGIKSVSKKSHPSENVISTPNLSKEHQFPESIMSSPESLQQYTIQSIGSTPDSLSQHTISGYELIEKTLPQFTQNLPKAYQFPESIGSTPETLQQHTIQSIESTPGSLTQHTIPSYELVQKALPQFTSNLFHKPEIPESVVSTPESLKQYTIQSFDSISKSLSQHTINDSEINKLMGLNGTRKTKTPTADDFGRSTSSASTLEQYTINDSEINKLMLSNSTRKTKTPTADDFGQSTSSASTLEQHTIENVTNQVPISLHQKIPKNNNLSALHALSMAYILGKNSNDVSKLNDSTSTVNIQSTEQGRQLHVKGLSELNSNYDKTSGNQPFASTGESTAEGQPTRYAMLPPRNFPPFRKISNEMERDYPNTTPIYQASSSEENLTEIFSGSKITYQSTPIKTAEELAEEKGILDEPDLTLVSSGMCSTISSPEKFRHHASSDVILKHDETLQSLLSQLKNSQLKSDASKEIPKKENSKVLSGMGIQATLRIQDTKIHMQQAASQSMISFLQHELSCYISSDSTEGSTETSEPSDDLKDSWDSNSRETSRPMGGKSVPEPSPSSSQKSGVKSKPHFKDRTKRLWNNLEEVKQKKLIEDKKKQMAIAREKVKELNKKISKKKSTPKK